MKLKKIAIRGFIGLAVVIALCFFFSETIKSISTPKVQLISPGTGRFEDKIALTGTVLFEKEKDFVIEEARKAEGIVIDKIYVSPGYAIEKDELIFTAHMPTYDTAIEKLEGDYTAKARELLDLEIANRSSSLTSQQNELHQAVIEKQTLSSQAEFEARALALEEKITLPRSTGDWKTAVITAGGSDELKEAADRANAAKMVYEETYKAFMDSYNNKKIKVEEELFTYISKRNSLQQELNDLMNDRIELLKLNLSVKEIRAPYDGYLLKLSESIAVGSSYDGNGVAYTMNEEGTTPLLRSVVEEKDTKKIVEGAKVSFEVSGSGFGGPSTISSTVTKVENNLRDGKRYAYIDLTEEMIDSLGPMSKMLRDGIEGGSITYRAKNSSTILPASAVRGGEDESYIYEVERNYGNILQGSSLKVKKTKVTVLERSDSKVSIQEEFWNTQVADREDRAISEGSAVMEYNQQ